MPQIRQTINGRYHSVWMTFDTNVPSLSPKTTSHIMVGMENKKQHLLQKGFEILYQKGYNGTGIQEIVDAAGVPKGSFYSYFDSKQAFALEALRHYTTLLDEEMDATLSDAAVPPLERIFNLYRQRLEFFRKVNYTLGCFAGNLTQELGDTNLTVRTALDDFFVHNRQPIARCLEEASQLGMLSSPLSAQELAEYIVNAYEGALLRMKASASEEPLLLFLKMLKLLLV